MDAHRLIHQDSLDTEYWTPLPIVKAARYVLRDIDLDPASCAAANERVRAARYFEAPRFDVVEEWGGIPVRQFVAAEAFCNPWRGRVFMNHPFSTGDAVCVPGCTKKRCTKRGWHTLTALPSNANWICYYVEQFKTGQMAEAINICFAATGATWFKPLLRYPQCFVSPRVNYDRPDGKAATGATKESVVTYLGNDVWRFVEAFEQFGEIKVSWKWLVRQGIDNH